MFCSKCGKECKENSRFCSGCGNVLIGREQTEKKEPVQIIKRPPIIGKNYIIFGIIGIIFVLCIFLTVSGKKTVTKEDIESTIQAFQLDEIEINEEIVDFNVTDINIISQNYDSQRKICVVNCEILVTSDTMKGTLVYCLKYKLMDGKWIIKSYELDEDRGYDFVPLKGVELSVEEIEKYVKELYPEICWKDVVDVWGDRVCTDFPIECEMVYHETNLDSGQDKISYNYAFYTEAACVSGNMILEYKFTEEGTWENAGFWCEDKEVKWQLEGLWSFDIYTYWIDVYISEIDWENQVAYIEQRGSVWQGYGTYQSMVIGFEQREGCIYFDSFVTESDNSGKEVTLIAKIDDLYYLQPNMFVGYDPIECPIGGKNTSN